MVDTGLFDKFFAYQQQKQDERNALCVSALSDITAANLALSKLLNDNPGYIYDYAYTAPLNEWQRLAKDTNALSRQLRKANAYPDWQKQSQHFLTTLNGLGASVSAHNKACLKEAIADAYKHNAGGTVYEMVVAFVTISNYKITGITKAISETQYLKDGLTTYTHSRSGTVHSLIGTGCNLRFRATADFVNGDTFSVNGTTVTASTPNKETVVNAFKADSMVTAQLNGSTLTLYSDAQTSANTAITNAATAQSTANNHIANKSNPHGVTKSQVGLSKVANVTTTMGYDGNLWISYS